MSQASHPSRVKNVVRRMTGGVSLTDTESFLRQWEQVQAKYGDLPGESGAQARADAYRPFFLKFGRDVFIAHGCRFYHPQRIVLEDDVRFNESALVYGSGGVRIGRHARIGPRLFLHSANHEIAPSPYAFHERGYEYAAVTIGDNCLLSANVSILPGVTLGAHTFVAAGAVVPGREYRDGARLAGVPARELASPPIATPVVRSAPVVAVCGAANDRRTEAMRHVIASLGVPTVGVFVEDEALPTSVKTVLWLRRAPRADETPTAWSLVDGDLFDTATMTLELETGRTFDLSTRRSMVVAPARTQQPLEQDAANITLYNALKRLRKRKREAADHVDLLLALVVLDKLPPDRDVQMVQSRVRQLLEADGVRDVDRPFDALQSRAKLGAGVRSSIDQQRFAAIRQPAIAAAPELVPLAAGRGVGEIGGLLDQWCDWLRKEEKAWPIACGIAAALIAGRWDRFDEMLAVLLSAPFIDEEAGCVRSAASETSGYSYLVVLGALLAAAAKRRTPGWQIELERDHRQSLRLAIVERDGSGPVRARGVGALASVTSRTIAAGLIDAWIEAVTPPALEAAQFELTDATYEPVVPALLDAWRAIFRRMHIDAGAAFVEVLPWPEGRRAAVSVRYDIDRATLPGQVRRIVEIQQRSFGGACGSWYAIPGTEHGAKIESTLRQHVQEIGVHGVRADHHDVAGRGVTMHSAPRSEYWRGARTLHAQASAHARYAELLSTATDRPQPAWLPDLPGCSLWTTPLHFPLEGSTSDVDLSYFDRLRHRFLGVLERGGHAIIGSHPDLHQEILELLAEREELHRCWCVPVADVVDRCQRLFSPGALTWVSVEGDARPHLRAECTVADVAIRMEFPDGRIEQSVVQCNAGQPRPIGPST